MSNIARTVSNQVFGKNPLGFDLFLYLLSALLEDTPFRKITVNNLHVVVLADVIHLDIGQTISRGFESLMNNIQIVIVMTFSFFLFAQYSFLDLQFCHFYGKHQRRHDTFFVENLCLPFVERQSIKNPSLAAVMK